MLKLKKSYEPEIVYKTVDEILNDINFHYEFEVPEAIPDLAELPKSILIESLLLKIKPAIPVAIHIGANKKKLPFYGQKELKALLDFVQNKYQIFRFNTLPELNGKCFNELPYVMRADLEKPIVKCYVFENLSPKEFELVLNHFNKFKL